MNTDMKAYSLESDTFYKSITRVSFTPIKEITCFKILHKKGDVEYGCNLFTGFKKKVKKVYTDNIIKVEYGCGESYKTSMQKYAERFKYLIKDDKLFSKAKVEIETNIKGGDRTLSFDSNEDAINHMNLVKQNCKTFGNTLI